MRLIRSVTAGGRRPLLFGLVLGIALTSAFIVATPSQAQQPAGRVFNMGAGMVLNYVKADKAADFENIVAKTKEALAKSAKPDRKQQLASWKVFKAAEPGPNMSVLYIFMIDPSVKDADYTIGNILNEAFPVDIQALFKTYTESYASGQISVNLTLVSDFAK